MERLGLPLRRASTRHPDRRDPVGRTDDDSAPKPELVAPVLQPPRTLDLEHAPVEREDALRRRGGDGRESEWLESWAWAPVAAGGLIGARGEIWSRDGRMLALGGSTLLCRPAVGRPIH